jgi:signal peptidase II
MSDTPPLPPARRPGLKATAVVLVAVVLVLDLWTKAWMQDRLGMDPEHRGASERITLVEGFLHFEGHWNDGITFGLAAGHTMYILIFTVLACLALLAAILWMRTPSALLHTALALILGGALGNLWDRWHWQAVRDFVVVYYWPGREWPAFNLADSCIVVGVGLVLGREIFGRGPSPAAQGGGA